MRKDCDRISSEKQFALEEKRSKTFSLRRLIYVSARPSIAARFMSDIFEEALAFAAERISIGTNNALTGRVKGEGFLEVADGLSQIVFAAMLGAGPTLSAFPRK